MHEICVYICIYIIFFICVYIYICIYLENHEFALILPIPIQQWKVYSRLFFSISIAPLFDREKLYPQSSQYSHCLSPFLCMETNSGPWQGYHLPSLAAFFLWPQTLMATSKNIRERKGGSCIDFSRMKQYEKNFKLMNEMPVSAD